VVKVIWHKSVSPQQMDGSVVFTRWRQCALPWEHIGAAWRIRLNLYFLGAPEATTQTANRSFQAFLHSSRQKVPILYNGRPFPPKLPLPMGDLDPHLTHDSLGPSEPTTQTASWSAQPFSRRWPQNVPRLYNGTPLPPPSKLPLPIGIWTFV